MKDWDCRAAVSCGLSAEVCASAWNADVSFGGEGGVMVCLLMIVRGVGEGRIREQK